MRANGDYVAVWEPAQLLTWERLPRSEVEELRDAFFV
jgi:hypothetical protein